MKFKQEFLIAMLLSSCLIVLLLSAGSCFGKDRSSPEKREEQKAGILKSEKLPPPLQKGKMSLQETLWGRKSVRSFKNKALDVNQLSQLLWAAQGINRQGIKFRTCPSAGATFPLETYIFTEEGIFHYNVDGHSISKLQDGDLRGKLASAALGQEWVAEAPLNIVFCAEFSRTTGRYGERGIMYVHMEAGHAAQNVHLQAVALGLGSVPIGAFIEGEVSKILKLSKNLKPLYIIPVGYPD